jgi:hypothetical protein
MTVHEAVVKTSMSFGQAIDDGGDDSRRVATFRLPRERNVTAPSSARIFEQRSLSRRARLLAE